jgi:hypothetical protein
VTLVIATLLSDFADFATSAATMMLTAYLPTTPLLTVRKEGDAYLDGWS